MPDLLWRIQVTASRQLDDKRLVPWGLRQARDEAVAAGATRLIVTHGAASGGDTQADQWARAEMAARRPALAVVPDAVPADWEPWCPQCTDGRTPPKQQPGHQRRVRPGTRVTYCPLAGHRRNADMVARQPPARRGVAFFQHGLPNRGTLHCALLLARAAIPLWCFCTSCGPKIGTEPCYDHQMREVTSGWFNALQADLYA